MLHGKFYKNIYCWHDSFPHPATHKKAFILALALILAAVSGCESSVPACMSVGSHRCTDMDNNGVVNGFLELCDANGEWEKSIVCKTTCDGKACAENSDIPSCNSQEIQCEVMAGNHVAIECRDNMTFPILCEDECYPEIGCVKRKFCHKDETICADSTDGWAVLFTCTQGEKYTASYCPTGWGCENNRCSEIKAKPETPRCGDGNVDKPQEACDVDSEEDFEEYGGGCGRDCQFTHYCGDGKLDAIDRKYGEECDFGAASNGAHPEQYNTCGSNCKRLNYCGDGIIQEGYEVCDDGNETDGDGCSSKCKLESEHTITCGDNLVEGDEQCDKQNLNNKTCADFSGFKDGMLLCDPETCKFDTSYCVECTENKHCSDRTDGKTECIYYRCSEPAKPPKVVISMAYPGGATNNAIYAQKYVTLFNAGGSDADISNWSIQYGSANGDTIASVCTLPTKTKIPAGGYYNVNITKPPANGKDYPDIDYHCYDESDPLLASATDGKLFLVANNEKLSSSTPSAGYVDAIGYGNANFAEGGNPVGKLSNKKAAIRKNGGCVDTDNNGNDFEIGEPYDNWSKTKKHMCDEETFVPECFDDESECDTRDFSLKSCVYSKWFATKCPEKYPYCEFGDRYCSAVSPGESCDPSYLFYPHIYNNGVMVCTTAVNNITDKVEKKEFVLKLSCPNGCSTSLDGKGVSAKSASCGRQGDHKLGVAIKDGYNRDYYVCYECKPSQQGGLEWFIVRAEFKYHTHSELPYDCEPW